MLKPIHIDRVQAALDMLAYDPGYSVGDVTSLHIYPRDYEEQVIILLKADDTWSSPRDVFKPDPQAIFEPSPQVMEEALKQLFGGDVSAVQSFDVALDEGVYTVILETDIPLRYDSGEMHTERRIGRVLR